MFASALVITGASINVSVQTAECAAARPLTAAHLGASLHLQLCL